MKSKRSVRVGLAIVSVLAISVTVYYGVSALRSPLQRVHQNAHIYAMTAGLELYRIAFEDYPPSDAYDAERMPYGGAQKLMEALLGEDGKGLHPDSQFSASGTDANGTELYLPSTPTPENLESRLAIHSNLKNVTYARLKDIYGQNRTDTITGEAFVICDAYKHRHVNRKKGAMPVLYYRAHLDRTAHDCNNPDNPNNIYDYRDNHALLGLGVPGKSEAVHPLYADPNLFYRMTQNKTTGQPMRQDSYILWSAGYDGLYGTRDDVTNFVLP